MGQVIFFALFIITALAGAFVYFSPTQKAVDSIKYAKSTDSNSELSPDEITTSKRDIQVDMKTSGGVLQILKELDDLSQEQKEYTDMITEEEQAIKNTKDEIAALQNQGVKSDQDLLRIKALGLQIQDQESLLVDNGRQLTDINDQLTQYRKLLNEQNNLVNISNRSSLESLQQHNDTVSDKASMFVDKVSQQSDDATQRSQDQQEKIRQKMEDEEQRIRDQRER